jgi:hypothetical protein
MHAAVEAMVSTLQNRVKRDVEGVIFIDQQQSVLPAQVALHLHSHHPVAPVMGDCLFAVA